MRAWPPEEAVRRIHVIRESSLGDVVLCEPIVAALAARYPHAALTVVTRTPWHPVFLAHPAVDAVATPDAPRAPADLAVDLQNRLRTRWRARDARWRRHWRKRRGLDLLAGLTGRPLHRTFRDGPHQVERMARDLGLEAPRRPRMYLHADWRAEALRWHPGRPFAILAPCTGTPLKTWPAARFAAVGAALRADGLAIRVLGGPGEGDRIAQVAAGIGQAVPASVDIGVAAALIEAAHLVICGDTGFAHVAAAVGTPVVAVFGPTAPGRWGPAPDQGVAVARDLHCAPCTNHGEGRCRLGHRACLDDLGSDPVVVAARIELQRRKFRCPDVRCDVGDRA